MGGEGGIDLVGRVGEYWIGYIGRSKWNGSNVDGRRLPQERVAMIVVRT